MAEQQAAGGATGRHGASMPASIPALQPVRRRQEGWDWREASASFSIELSISKLAILARPRP